jgi:hypothetical protein
MLTGETLQLWKFAHNQRSFHREGTLQGERYDKLVELGFDFEPEQCSYQPGDGLALQGERYDKLVELGFDFEPEQCSHQPGDGLSPTRAP